VALEKEMNEPEDDDFPLDDLSLIDEGWRERLHDDDPLLNIIIKGHLLLEEKVNLFVEKAFAHGQFLRGFQFHQKLRILRARHQRGDSHHVWELIELLNTLRNDCAHNFPEKTGKRETVGPKIADFLEAELGWEKPDPIDEELMYEDAFAYATARLVHMTDHFDQ
jgi:hypothetical protein